jgi:hypothetical protein
LSIAQFFVIDMLFICNKNKEKHFDWEILVMIFTIIVIVILIFIVSIVMLFMITFLMNLFLLNIIQWFIDKLFHRNLDDRIFPLILMRVEMFYGYVIEIFWSQSIHVSTRLQTAAFGESPQRIKIRS